MVNLKEIKEVLKKLTSNLERLKYLNKLLEEVEDKKLIEDIKLIIKNIREIEAVTQIETKGRVEWSIPEEEPKEERRLERQVVGIPVGREEEAEEKVKYGVSHSGITYVHDKMGGDYIHSKIVESLRNENMAFDENLPIGEDQKKFIEERVRKYMPTASEEKIQEETSSVMRSSQYLAQDQDSRGYASLGEEIHDKERKRRRH